MDTMFGDLALANRPAFSDTVQVCGKCCKKLGEEGKALRRALKAAIAETYGDAVTVEKTDCFSLCPKGGQTVAAYAKKQSPRLLILEPGSDPRLAADYLLRIL